MSQKKYIAYLLRLWQDNSEAPWRAMLQNSNTGEKINFASVEALHAYLSEKTILWQTAKELNAQNKNRRKK